MRWLVGLGCVLALAAGCEKKHEVAPSPTASTPGSGSGSGSGTAAIGSGGAAAPAAAVGRRIAVEAGPKGFVPDSIPATPGEALVLVVTRTEASDCLSQLVVAGGAPVALPMNAPVEVAVTAPSSGKLTFACGMDMFRGAIVVGS